MRKTKEEQIFSKLWILKNVLKIRDKLCTFEYMRLINGNIRNF